MDDPRNGLLTWCEVDAEALRHNLALFRSLLHPETRLLLVVKANAYGHGLALVTRLANEYGVDALGVHQIDEAAAVRTAGWTGPLLVMGQAPRARLIRAFELGLEMTVFDLGTIEALERLGRHRGASIPCHLKLETGTHRQGVPEEEVEGFLEFFRHARGVFLAGLSTHYANIEDTTDHSFAGGQLERFRRLSERVRGAGFDGLVLHTACTAAVLTMPETQFDMVRLGIGAYGLWPSRETLASARMRPGGLLDLRPALTWKARVGQLKWTPAGAFIGYGCAHRTGRRTRLAVLPVGYADGYDRSLSGLAHVLIRDHRAPVLGRVCMNMILVDVTDIEGVEMEDEAVLLGRQGSEEVRAADLAAQAQTIPYEIVSRLSPLLPRIAVDSAGRPVANPS